MIKNEIDNYVSSNFRNSNAASFRCDRGQNVTHYVRSLRFFCLFVLFFFLVFFCLVFSYSFRRDSSKSCESEFTVTSSSQLENPIIGKIKPMGQNVLK